MPVAAKNAPKRRAGRRRGVGRPHASKRAVESPQVILDAALRAFGESGYEEMSVRRLAGDLGVSHNLISHYFESKEELWRACVDWSLGEINREMIALATSIGPDTDIIDTMRTMMERFIHLAAKFPANLFIITQEGASGGSRLDYLYEKMMAPAHKGLDALMERAWKEGRIRKVDPRTTFFLLTHGGASIFSLVPLAERMGGPHPLDEEFIATQARDVADIILRGIMLDPPPLAAKPGAFTRGQKRR